MSCQIHGWHMNYTNCNLWPRVPLNGHGLCILIILASHWVQSPNINIFFFSSTKKPLDRFRLVIFVFSALEYWFILRVYSHLLCSFISCFVPSILFQFAFELCISLEFLIKFPFMFCFCMWKSYLLTEYRFNFIFHVTVTDVNRAKIAIFSLKKVEQDELGSHFQFLVCTKRHECPCHSNHTK